LWNPGFSFGYTISYMRQGSALTATLLSVILLAACSSVPESYPLPEQRTAVANLPSAVGMWAWMNDPSASDYIVRDVSQAIESNSWRWTFKRPELKFFLASIDAVKFVMDFSIAEHTFRETGPVTLSFFVNGKLLAKARYDKWGQFRFEKPVDPSMLQADSINHVAIEPDRLWVSKADGVTLGIILIAAGFAG